MFPILNISFISDGQTFPLYCIMYANLDINCNNLIWLIFSCIEYNIRFNVRSVSRGIWRCRQAFSGQQQHFIIVLETALNYMK